MLAYEIKSDQDDNILIIDTDTLKSYYPEEIAIHLFMSFKLKAETFLSKKFGIFYLRNLVFCGGPFIILSLKVLSPTFLSSCTFLDLQLNQLSQDQ